MAVRVLIEREVLPDSEAKMHQILRKLRGKAIQVKGYISGETLRSYDNPRKFLVIGTWNTLDDWKAWEADPERMKIQQDLTALLTTPEKTSIYSHL